MTGTATLLEAARLLSDPCRHAANTVRFVAADYEEMGPPGLEGASQYASYIKNLSTTQGWKLVAVQDYEQSGWNCADRRRLRQGRRRQQLLRHELLGYRRQQLLQLPRHG